MNCTLENILSIAFPNWDRDLFVYINSKHIPSLDPILFFLSSYVFWIVFFFILMAYIIYKNRSTGIAVALFILVSVGSNFVINRIVKLLVMRPRPGADPLIHDIAWQLETVGASSSFFSGHASCSFSLALFTSLYFKNKFFTIAIFFWAIIVSYSRIYVGKHYPLDIIVGAAFGIITGWLTYLLYNKYLLRKNKIPYPSNADMG